MARPQQTTSRITGVTLTELLLVLAIISLLSAVITPTIVRRQANSRINIAEADVREMGQAEEAVGILYDYYVPLQVLDDLAGDDPLSDAIGSDEPNIQLIDLLESVDTQIQPSLSSSVSNGRVAKLVDDWQGPFIQFQRKFRLTDDPNDVPTLRRGHPLDPWGNPYILYSPNGVIGSGASGLANSDNYPEEANFDDAAFSNGNLTNLDDRFDRFAVLSFGPDGIRGSDGVPAEFGDDIIYFFGHVEPETNP